ncbi:MAG: hypothetical protein COX62_02075 [Deltaproteobacteria bacterium CG_4_10_14_0_2_um_filter_43_8]|nr:MAG: hypothetical protein COV43_04075 [Deltaproteobacteria bacterium CG11_big_fil_rev_8_21_14_0_20_42_23]PJA21563.1 MAG: hypothetical protein COX62_02075 [Deltaproteobacteria bacterium CG_4_10_14_0_2_um_filter_43_8]PJC64897.1 MAG: hypothetical protein CO021_01960 [Deltaproteobacteria bacterium CG_4_9_14_0_2_um_filter_42_21]
MKRFVLLIVLFSTFSFSVSAFAQVPKRDGWYFAGGYEQHVFYSRDHRKAAVGVPSSKITFGPGFGLHVMGGYHFPQSRFGIQVPIDYSNVELNRRERINTISVSAEGVMHLKEWENGAELHLLSGLGTIYFDEGEVDNKSRDVGALASFGAGISVYFNQQKKNATALNIEVPLQAIYFPRDRLSGSGTFVFSVPIRVGVLVRF